MYNPFTLEGKTILITGASSGIGRATAIECSKMGARIVVTARNKERLEATFSELQGQGHSSFLCNLADEESLNAMIADMPLLDGLVNNAGYTDLVPVQFINHQKITNILRTNTVAPILLFQKLLKKRKINNNSSVVFTSSLAGIGYGIVGNSMYSASKGAISAFVRVASKELANKRIRVNAVCPGMVKTEILSKGSISNTQLIEDEKNYPLGYGEPIDVALMMVYLLSDASKWVTGSNLVIDGGVS